MPGWLTALIYLLPGWLQGPLRVLVDAIKQVWSWFDGLARRVVPNWNRLVGAAQWLAGGLWELARDVTGTLQWLAYVAIPAARNYAINVVVAWAVQRLTEARAFARSLVDSLSRWVVDRLRDLGSLLDSFRRWTVDRLTEAAGVIGRLARRVFGDWATPTRLAEWLVGAMWAALLRFVWGNLDRFSDYLWRRRQAILLTGARVIERTIARLL